MGRRQRVGALLGIGFVCQDEFGVAFLGDLLYLWPTKIVVF